MVSQENGMYSTPTCVAVLCMVYTASRQCNMSEWLHSTPWMLVGVGGHGGIWFPEAGVTHRQLFCSC